MTYKTTPEHFLKFEEYCEQWQRELSLLSWKIYYKHESCSRNLADCSTNYSGRVATIRLNTTWNIPVTLRELNESALHECLEVLLSPLLGQAQSRMWEADDYLKDHHAVIRTLEYLLLRRS